MFTDYVVWRITFRYVILGQFIVVQHTMAIKDHHTDQLMLPQNKSSYDAMNTVLRLKLPHDDTQVYYLLA